MLIILQRCSHCQLTALRSDPSELALIADLVIIIDRRSNIARPDPREQSWGRLRITSTEFVHCRSVDPNADLLIVDWRTVGKLLTHFSLEVILVWVTPNRFTLRSARVFYPDESPLILVNNNDDQSIRGERGKA